MRVTLYFVVAIVAFYKACNCQEPSTLLWKPADLLATKLKYHQGDVNLKQAVSTLRAKADAFLKQGPWTVMNKPTVPPSGDKHDYVSLDKYYWPCNVNVSMVVGAKDCNKTTGLPWVQHDGYVNPEMHLYDHDALINMTMAVIHLSLGWFYTGESAYAEHAANILDVWFLNDATKMNPNLNFGHFIPGVTTGVHGAIIDSHYFPEMLDAVAILATSNAWSLHQHDALLAWFASFGTWLSTSKLGVQEANATNNHGVWYDVQTGFVLAHAGQHDKAKAIATAALDKRVNAQITADGQLPQEEARTKSWSYNEFCLNAFFHLGKFAELYQIDLWDTRIKTALNWQLPYITQHKKWTLPQVVPFLPSDGCVITAVDQCIGSYFNILRMASVVYHDNTYEQAATELPGIDYHANLVNLLYPKATTTIN